MARDNDIIDKIKELLPLCNDVDSNYNLDWTNCTINRDNDDVNSVKDSNFPYIDAEIIDEYCDNKGQNTQFHTNVKTLILDCIPVKFNATRNDLDNVILDIKRFFNQNNTLGGTVFTLWYSRYDKFTNQIAGKVRGVRITFLIKCFEDKINP